MRALPQVRTKFNEGSIAELAADIEAHGLLQPIVVQPDGKGYTVIIGERRLRALQKAHAAFVPAIVASIDKDQREEIQIIENIQREDLSAKDLTASVHKLWKKHGSVAKVAKILNKSKSWVSNRLAIALDVGPLTLQLLDANVKDTELLYAFATLEKADEQRARSILPDMLDGIKKRKDVQDELQIALGKKADEKPEEKNPTGDLFEDNPEIDGDDHIAGGAQAHAAYRIALDALKKIEAIPKGFSPLAKWEEARDIVKAALEAIDPAT